MTPRILVYCPLNPVTPRIYARTLTSLFRMAWDGPIDYVFGRDDHEPLMDFYPELTRKYNDGREMALQGGYDALLTVEADMIVPPLTLKRLTALDTDVAYGLYCSRHGRYQWLAFTELEETRGVSLAEDHERAVTAWGQAVETAGVGLGCTLIWRHVLEQIPFRVEPHGSANDWYFSLDLLKHGFRQMHDLGVVCGHISGQPTPMIIWPDPDAPRLYSIEPFEDAKPVKVDPSQPVTIELDRMASKAVWMEPK